MKERPILFSAPMVRAIREGRKTQTRRVVKGVALDWLRPNGFTPEFVACPENGLCPYGQPGDRLWVRETWATQRGRLPGDGVTFYRADGEYPGKQGVFSYVEREARWRPSIHMPRWASRIDLEVTGVRVERLQDISEEDASAEGYAHHGDSMDQMAPSSWFSGLWESINGPGSWDANPWVWVVEFKRVKP